MKQEKKFYETPLINVCDLKAQGALLTGSKEWDSRSEDFDENQ